MTQTIGLGIKDLLAPKRAEILALAEQHGAYNVRIFGSFARGEATMDSDVDFLVEFTKPGGLFQLFRVQNYLEDILGCPIDLGTEDALREHLREPVLKEAIRAF